MTRIVLGAVIVSLVMFILVRITRVGVAREPITPGQAAAATVIGGLLIAGLVYVWSQT